MVEGEKSVAELIHSDYKISEINASNQWIESNAELRVDYPIKEASKADLERMSFFKSPSPVLAIASEKDPILPDFTQKWTLCLDGINDPGNLGTIIRIADWYGIKQVLCSTDTVDLYNPKSISSTMGSFTRVDVIYTDLTDVLPQSNSPLLFTLMEGESVVNMKLTEGGIIVIGSEANGISKQVLSLQHKAITIPRIGQAESLNAGVATAIICDRLIQ